MNCLEFRRRLLEDPFDNDEELLKHEQQCQNCESFAVEVRAQEVQIRNTLKSIEPPPDMVDRILFETKFDEKPSLPQKIWFAAAASIMLTVAVSIISLMSTSWDRSNVALAQSVLHHIDDESHHLREIGPVKASNVKYLFNRFGADVTGDLGIINFAAECLMRQHTGVHLILPGKEGPITVFFMPGESAESEVTVNSERFQGEILPTSWGSVAVVGEQGENIDGIAEKMLAATHWPDKVAAKPMKSILLASQHH